MSDISQATRGYIADYPTTTGACGDDLVILGYPRTAYWKLMWNTFDYEMIASLPRTLLIFFMANCALVFLIYMAVSYTHLDVYKRQDLDNDRILLSDS